MKKIAALFLLIASIGTTLISTNLHSTESREKEYYLDTYWVENDQELALIINIPDGYMYNNCSIQQDDGVIGCEISFTPLVGTVVLSNTSKEIAILYLSLMIDTKTSPIMITEVVIEQYSEEIADFEIKDLLNYTLGNRNLDLNKLPVLFDVSDNNDESLNKCGIGFSKIKAADKR